MAVQATPVRSYAHQHASTLRAGLASLLARTRWKILVDRPGRLLLGDFLAVDGDRIDPLIEEAQQVLDFGALGNRVGVGPDNVLERPVADRYATKSSSCATPMWTAATSGRCC